MYVLYNIQGNVLLTKLMRKLYQILYTVGRLTYAPARRAFFFLGDTWAVGVSLSGGHLSSGRFPFRGTLEQWAGLRGGKALGVTKPAFPPRAPPFRARRCSALWYGVVYWQMPVCCCIGGIRLSRFFFAGRKAVCAADLFLVVVVLLALICSCLLFYCWS